ncbi:MAG TPA: Holliday junction resolvase RuvX [Nevskiaceae bacterium]
MVGGNALCLAFDYGLRRIGVAVGHPSTGRARPLKTITQRGDTDWRAIEAVVREWSPGLCVVGLPLNEHGGGQEMTARARDFARSLEQRCHVPVRLCDERFSSRSAEQLLRQARASGELRRRVRKGEGDGVAASLILEQYLASRE